MKYNLAFNILLLSHSQASLLAFLSTLKLLPVLTILPIILSILLISHFNVAHMQCLAKRVKQMLTELKRTNPNFSFLPIVQTASLSSKTVICHHLESYLDFLKEQTKHIQNWAHFPFSNLLSVLSSLSTTILLGAPFLNIYNQQVTKSKFLQPLSSMPFLVHINSGAQCLYELLSSIFFHLQFTFYSS